MEPRGSHLFARAEGTRTRACVSAMALQIFDAALANAKPKVLVDVRRLEGRLRILDNYLLVTELFEKLRGKGLRKAAIVDRRDPSIRDWFLETVARNRGFNLRIFSDPREALDWLEQEPPGGHVAG